MSASRPWSGPYSSGQAMAKRIAEQLGRVHPARQHVVGVADPGDLGALDRAAMLFEGLDVGHHLAGMGAARQPVDHRHVRGAGEIEQIVMVEDADHDRIDIAAHDAGGVGQRLLAGELHLVARQEHRLAAELAHADIEADAGARRLLLEDHRQHLVREQLGALAALGAGLQFIGDGQHAAQLVFGEILEGQEMSRRGTHVHFFLSRTRSGAGAAGRPCSCVSCRWP